MFIVKIDSWLFSWLNGAYSFDQEVDSMDSIRPGGSGSDR